ncbi:MAG: amidohydrolase family protein [Actinomycetota bacterium]|nr:amidohydrolase family protein [Actinomycetota bacterium]
MLIKSCRLKSGDHELFDLRISGEIISAIEPAKSVRLFDQPGEEIINALGALLTSSLAEPHAHLDKAFLSERIANPTGDLMGAINAMESHRNQITVADTIERAERAVRLMVRNGVTAIRTHADVTEWNSLDSVEALLEVRSRTSDIVEMQICALLGWPLSGQDGKANLARGKAVIKLGVDFLGGCPHLDVDAVGANMALLELASELGCGLDLHTDEHTEVNRISLEDLAERVIATGFSNSVTASHCVSLGMQNLETQKRISEKVATANIGVVTLPHTNLFLQARDNHTAPPRGLTAIAALRAAGVRVAAGADNLQDPFNPIGRGDPLESAALLILAAHQLPNEAFAAVSSTAKSVMGLSFSEIEIGGIADLMLTPVHSIREAIATAAPRSMVMRRGKITHSIIN